MMFSLRVISLVCMVCLINLVVSQATEIQSWLTNCDLDGEVINLLQPRTIQPTTKSDVNIIINSTDILQQIYGFGAGLPQSSAYNLINLKNKNLELYQTVMNKIFSPTEGINMNMVRFPIGSCDFSMHNTTYDETTYDYKLTQFAIDSDSEYIVTVLLDALQINPKLMLIASPWSPPSWLKKYDSLIPYNDSNTLIDTAEVYNTYANYLLKVLTTYENLGLKISYLTLQNEPLFGDSQTYAGMYMSPDQQMRLSFALSNLKLPSYVKLLTYDHNWDHPEYPSEVLKYSDNVFAGTAWHCYAGDMTTALDRLGRLFPTYEQHVTECTGSYPDSTCDITQGMTAFGYNHEWDMVNIFLGATAQGSQSGLKWIMTLDEDCGPVLPGVEFDFGRPLVSIPTTAETIDDIYFNQDYWTIAHMSEFIPAFTSYRIGSESIGTQNTSILSVTYQDQNTHMFTSIIMNLNHEQSINVSFNNGLTQFTDILPAFSTVIYQWKD